MVQIPKVPETTRKPPTVAELVAAPPRIPSITLPDGWVVFFPPSLQPAFSGTGSFGAELSGIFSLEANFAGTGSFAPELVPVIPAEAAFSGAGDLAVEFVQLETIEAAFGGSGSFSAEVENFVGITAQFGGEGQTTADVVPVLVTEFGGTGTTHVGLAVNAGFSGTGTAQATVTQMGSLTANFSGTGTTSATLVSFDPMGMDKSSATTSLSGGTTAKIQGWSVRSGFPATSIVNDGLVSNGSANVSVQWKVTLASAWGNATGLQIQLRKNNTTIATVTIPFNATTATFNAVSTSLASSDRLELWYVTPFGATGTLASGSTNTFLHYSQV
ncbi:hypothetical protein [Nocardia abscessus]|uniref:hypothetical protein n=1 Tax=Nocardia abscessus TaxID=120957 RepID=UPI0024557548|nr:hypothetical protein [Nocardia abscessus]